MMDNYDVWEAHESELEAERSKYPVCAYCGEPITDEVLFDVSGELYHKKCAVHEFCKYTDDYKTE